MNLFLLSHGSTRHNVRPPVRTDHEEPAVTYLTARNTIAMKARSHATTWTCGSVNRCRKQVTSDLAHMKLKSSNWTNVNSYTSRSPWYNDRELVTNQSTLQSDNRSVCDALNLYGLASGSQRWPMVTDDTTSCYLQRSSSLSKFFDLIHVVSGNVQNMWTWTNSWRCKSVSNHKMRLHRNKTTSRLTSLLYLLQHRSVVV